MCACARVSLYMFKRRCRWQEVPEVPAVYRAPLKVSKVGQSGGGGGGWRGVPEVRVRAVASATAYQIASSPLLVTVGFFSFCRFLFAQPTETHLATHRLPSPIRTQGNGPFPLFAPLLSPFFFTLLSFSVFSSNSAPVPSSITEVQ